ncbi:FMRFamide neuropeptides 1 [Trichostrongylus colubriformis]|uniref:FMRFamide neuropeptides 1 n=1 Tax=Trichostrongylus colubriformis TaxID=6319 RepID=A0AAN8G4L5_TRICO
MTTLLQVGLLVALGAIAQAAAECCTNGDQSDFCMVFNMLSPMEQAEVTSYLGESCSGDADEALKLMEKRKPNFMRFGRSPSFGKKGSDPNFLRFGRNQPNFLRFGKAAGDPNFLRFGRAAGDPNFLRFGKRGVDPNFLRFGRKPNFLRFGK